MWCTRTTCFHWQVEGSKNISSLFFRYCLGDIVKVVGFHNQCPVVEFQYRYTTNLKTFSAIHILTQVQCGVYLNVYMLVPL